MYPRLFLARQLLRDDGVIFVSIDDNEVHNLRMIMNEVFGEENFIAELIWEKRKGGGNDSQFIASDHEYILCFIRNKTEIDSRWFVPYDKEYLARYSEKDEKGAYYWDTISRKGLKNPIIYEVTAPDGKKITLYAQLSERSFREKLATNEIRFSRKGTDWSVQRKIDKPEGTVLRSVVDDVATNADGKNELRALFDELDIFSNPKPTMLVRKLMLLSTQSGDLILDFFAGSGTTAHAIMAQNIDDSGSRRFILVQLPEPIPEESEARKAGYKTIADISKERLRRAGKKLKDGLKQQKLGDKQEVDLGFKIFKLAESNYRSWSGVDEKEPEAYAKQMTLFNDPLVKGWKPESVIWEVAIKEGYGLNSKIDSVKDVKANKVFIMTDSDNQRSFRICLDDELKPALLKELGLSKTDLFVCRDVALTDELAANLALQCRLKTI
jgi:adenine-specific DNA-methyltransferase